MDTAAWIGIAGISIAAATVTVAVLAFMFSAQAKALEETRKQLDQSERMRRFLERQINNGNGNAKAL